MSDERYERGRTLLERLNPKAPPRLDEQLQEIAPDFERFIFEFPFGDVYSRPGLDLKMRELITVASLVTLGTAPTQLKSHLQAALNVGWTKKELTEAIIQLAVYAGFPAALNAFEVAKEAFAEYDDDGAEKK